LASSNGVQTIDRAEGLGRLTAAADASTGAGASLILMMLKAWPRFRNGTGVAAARADEAID
jgi:hypothetical protein